MQNTNAKIRVPQQSKMHERKRSERRGERESWRLCRYSPSISVVLPARNEAANLSYVLPLIPKGVMEVVLVDGHSTDGTIAEAQRLLPTIRVLQQKGWGKGDALRLGCEASRGEIIVLLDADGSTDPQELPQFVDALMQGNDFAKGSRFLPGGGSADLTLLRRWGNWCLQMTANVLFGTQFSDLCYGYNAFWRDCLQDVAIDCAGFEVETLLSIRMQRAKRKIVEIPSFEYERIYGQSNLRAFHDGWRVLRTIFREWIVSKRMQLNKFSTVPHLPLLHSEHAYAPIEDLEAVTYGKPS